MLGASRPPYRDWTWKDLGKKLSGPHILRLPDGRVVPAGRLDEGKVRTGLCWLDTEAGTLTASTWPKFDCDSPALKWQVGDVGDLPHLRRALCDTRLP